MQDTHRTLTRMLVSTMNAQETQCSRVSRTLHDEVGQVLSAVGLQLDVLKLEFQDRVPEIAQRTAEIQGMLEQAVSQVCALSYDLNPAVVERAGLHFALDRLIGRYREQFKGTIRMIFDPSVRVPLDVGNAWYKIADHALSNVMQHAAAKKVEVYVRPSGRQLSLEIRDDGTGFTIGAAPGPGLGLLMMEHHAAQAGLVFSIKSSPGKGVTVRAVYRPDAPPHNGDSETKEA